MIRAGVGIATRADVDSDVDPSSEPGELAATAIRRALAAFRPGGASPPEAAWVAATGLRGGALSELALRSTEALSKAGVPTSAMLGTTADGLIGEGREVRGEPGVMALVLGGVRARALLLEDLAGDEARAGSEIEAALSGGPRREDLCVVLPDPEGLDVEALLSGLRTPLRPAQVVGAATASDPGAEARAWLGRGQVRRGVAVWCLRLGKPARLRTAQAGRALTPVLEVTRVRGHWLLSLGGRSALQVFREAARRPLADDLARASRFVKVAIDPPEPAAAAARRDSARPGEVDGGAGPLGNVVGFDVRRGAICLSEPVRSGHRLALVGLDAQAAREDLGRSLQDLEDFSAGFGLALGCRARGEALFSVSGLEAGYLERALRGAPVAGVHGPYQLGPGRRREIERLTYAAVLALVDA